MTEYVKRTVAVCNQRL